MATVQSEEALPRSKDSVLLRETLSVVETPQKKVVLVEKQNSEDKVSEDHQKQSEMEVDLTEDNVISPDNQT